MPGPFQSFPSVPIIGAPTVIEWRPIVSVVCACGRGRPMLISSTDQIIKCDGCQKLYALSAVRYDRQSGEGAGIGLMEVHPASVRNGQPNTN